MSQADPLRLTCPRCNILLFVGQAADIVLYACGSCGGLWLDDVRAHRVGELLSAQAMALADSAEQHASVEVDQSAPIKCVVCEGPLTRTRIQAAGVEIDRCSAHGTWYDRHELQQVAAALGRIREQRDKASGGAGAPAAAPAQSRQVQWKEPVVQDEVVEVVPDLRSGSSRSALGGAGEVADAVVSVASVIIDLLCIFE